MEGPSPTEMSGVVQGIEPGPGAIRWPQGALGGAHTAVPEDDVAGLLFRHPADDLAVHVQAHHPRQAQPFVVGELGGLEGVPGEHEPFGQGVQVGLALQVGQALDPPAFHLAAGGVQGVLGGGQVGVPVIGEEFPLPLAAPGLGLGAGRAALDRPMPGELLQGRAEARQVEIDAPDTGVLKFLDATAHGGADARFQVFPVEGIFRRALVAAGAADQEDGAVGGGLVLDVQGAFRLGVHRPGGGDNETRLHQALGQGIPGAGGLVGEHQGHEPVRLQHPAAFGEDGGHAQLVVLAGQVPGALLVLELGRVGDGLVLLVGEGAAEEFGVQVAGGALEPDIEEVR